METLKRWRLILGKQAEEATEIPLSAQEKGMDDVLEALYDSNRQGGLGSSSPNVNRWLGDIRKYFPGSVVQIMQRDALERLGLDRMLLEPELLAAVEPDIHLVGALLSLNKVLPAQSRETAALVVRKVVEDIEKRLRAPLREAVQRALNRQSRNRRPRHHEIDWHRTIRQNLKHYQPAYKTIIPVRLAGYNRSGQALKHIILLMDQSGSMAPSVVYAGVLGAALASIRSVRTQVVAFDTAVVDLSAHLADPVALLFGTQLGGGTDIARALTYAETLVSEPRDTILILISDLFEGGNRVEMLKKAAALRQAGVRFITLLALDDRGAPAWDHDNAAALSAMDIPVMACTPDKFPELIAAAIQGNEIK